MIAFVEDALAQAASDYLHLFGDGSNIEEKAPGLLRLGVIIVALEYLHEANKEGSS